MTFGRRAVGLAAALTALSAGATATAATSGPSHHPGPAAASKQGGSGWARLSSGSGVTSNSSIGLSRFSDQVEAVWAENSGSSESVVTRSVDPSGQPAGPTATVVSDWTDINNYPAIFNANGTRVVAFSGLRSSDVTDPYSAGYEYIASSPDGGSWTLGQGALSGGAGAYGSAGTDVVNAGGTPVTVYSSSSGPLSFHVGAYATIPDQPTDDPTAGDPSETAYNGGVGYDVNSGDVVAVWASNGGGQGTAGVTAQLISPVVTPPVHAPKSSSTHDGTASSLAPVEQRIQVASPPDGGVFVGYPVGYPKAKKVALWQLRSSHVLLASSGGNAERVDAAPGNGATLWLIWWDKGSNSIDLLHSTADGIDTARQCSVALPNSSNVVWDVEGQGVGKKVDLFINDSKTPDSKPQIYNEVVGCARPNKHHG